MKTTGAGMKTTGRPAKARGGAVKANDTILLERDGPIGWIRINRPERLNAFAGAMREEIEAALLALEEDRAIRCVVITGTGRAFSTGGDIEVMADLIERDDVEAFAALVETGARIVRTIDRMTKPVIAAVNGPAAGAGACLALASDLRIASETASIGFTFLRVGLHPDWGGSYFLPRLVGPGRAAELILTGGMIAAERAERLGIFNRVVPATELEPAARDLALQIAAGPPRMIAAAKRSLRRSLSGTLDEVLDLEITAQSEAFGSSDFREGIKAFLEKRAPRFGK
jgi:2-(1,2-epoxy-1,2-dihydrophenyl)acetyl-CoA isomerase